VKAHQQDIKFLAFLSESKVILTQGETFAIKFWNTNTLECIKTVKLHMNVIKSIVITNSD